MSYQLSMLSLLEGEQRRDKGMQVAIDHANDVYPNWAEVAYNYLCNWLKTVPVGYSFMAEDIRLKSEVNHAVPEPPNKRAWGGIIVRARNAKLIISNGTRPVKNSNANCANANVWIKI